MLQTARHRSFLLLVLIFAMLAASAQQSTFVKRIGHQFRVAGKPYYYIGANYWYGGLLALQRDPERGKQRLIKELDFLKSKGISNLRVLAGSEGFGKISAVDRAEPALQKDHQIFDLEVLKGLDFLLMELAKRKMYAVLYLSNNWEWSGGFMQYLNWNGQLADTTMRRKLSWDEQRDYTSKFYSCTGCLLDYRKQLDFILRHKNAYTGKKYRDEPAIMAWELANEPRPMRETAIAGYKEWISGTASYIKSIDPNHLITIGTEGVIGTESQPELYKEIHADKHVDYLTIHIWPKNWMWFTGSPTKENLPSVMGKTSDYIKQHEGIALELNKPLVIEEFGLPRDGHVFDPAAGTTVRDAYFERVFSIWATSRSASGVIAGCNFWGFGGSSRPIKGQLFWKSGDDFSGDPPQEEQGLNSVFDSDASTWEVLRRVLKR